MQAVIEPPLQSLDQALVRGTPVRTRPEPESPPRGCLTFRLGRETYCIDILHVQEIRGYSAPTRIANAPAAIKGVVNLRGTIVPVVDLRNVFGIAEPCYDAVTATIVVAVGDRRAGIVVDAVADVVEFHPDQLSPPPCLDGASTSDFITGLATVKTDDRSEMFILIDVARLLAGPSIGLA